MFTINCYLRYNEAFIFVNFNTYKLIIVLKFTAKLLREDNNDRVAEKNRDLLEAADRGRRGDHVRLQVPARGREDTVSVRRLAVPGLPQLNLYSTLSIYIYIDAGKLSYRI